MRKAALILAIVAVASSFVELGSLQANQPQSANRPQPSAFEVASVKTNRSGEPGAQIRPQPDGGFSATNAPLLDLLQFSYGYPGHRIAGLSGWALTDRFDISARGTTTPQTPAGGMERIALSLRALLADRFLLRTHTETRQAPVYELRLDRADGRLGPRLTGTKREDCRAMLSGRRPTADQEPTDAPRCGIGTGNGSIRAGGVPLSQFAEALGRLLERPVVDRTGLTGTFDVVLSFSPEGTLELPPPPGPQPRVDQNAPSIFTALREQLGLKLDSGRGAVEMLVVDSVQRPTVD